MSRNKPIISVKGLSKKFNNIHVKPPRDGIRDILGSAKKNLKSADDRFRDGEFWALQDINFDVYRGETLGVIGANGAGKSTLLKILSKVYRPTEGSFDMHGRVSSLLEVGVGFHPDLTGRENIYFNGALLGMKKNEITERIDEIIEFSELERFIDTPIKYYSSGMRSKLGFSVAVNLDAEIMIIDEALAVGDSRFREKSLQKMKESAFSGKTVLFVTHSLGFVEEACDRVLFLKNGRVQMIAEPSEAIQTYLKDTTKVPTSTWKKDDSKKADSRIIEKSINVQVNGKIGSSEAVKYSDKTSIKVAYETDISSHTYRLGYTLFDDHGRRLWRQDAAGVKKGLNTIEFLIDTSILKPGTYQIAADALIEGDRRVVDPKQTEARISFAITDNRKDIYNDNLEGIIKPPLRNADDGES